MVYTQIERLAQEKHNSSVLAMELHLSCTNPSKYCTHALRNKILYKFEIFNALKFKSF